MKIRYALLPMITICTAAIALGQGKFDGTWQLNQGKSQLAGDTMQYSDLGNGELKFTNSVQTYVIKTDGSPIQTPLGGVRTFKKVDDQTYENSLKRDGVLLSTAVYELSADGKTLTINSKGTRPNGDTFENHLIYMRTAGAGKGIAGSWKSTEVKLSSPAAITIASAGKDDVTFQISALKATCAGKCDGKDYALAGPTTAKGLTMAFVRTSPNSFKIVRKVSGKAIDIENYTLSADGHVLTGHGTDGEGKEPYTEIYDKQS